MKILCIRTDNPEAEVYLYDDQKRLGEIIWHAHRELGDTIHKQIKKLLDVHKLSLQDLDGITCFRGPGSFTGLRIGLTVVNTIADELKIPIVGETGEQWLEVGIKEILDGKNNRIVMPEYGRDPHITTQKR
jgi:tRNA threonylcarbamoyladenosine biosynthesis protein TsaB